MGEDNGQSVECLHPTDPSETALGVPIRAGGRPRVTSAGTGQDSTAEEIVDRSAAWATAAIGAWASAWKGLIDGEPYGSIAELVVRAGTSWFDWAKSVQELPYMGGTGQRFRQ
jgi:hypothetical protein